MVSKLHMLVRQWVFNFIHSLYTNAQEERKLILPTILIHSLFLVLLIEWFNYSLIKDVAGGSSSIIERKRKISSNCCAMRWRSCRSTTLESCVSELDCLGVYQKRYFFNFKLLWIKSFLHAQVLIPIYRFFMVLLSYVCYLCYNCDWKLEIILM